MVCVQTDCLSGSEVSLDDSSPQNLDKLVKVAKELLEEPVAERDIDTGELVPMPNGETNRQALKRLVNHVSYDELINSFLPQSD